MSCLIHIWNGALCLAFPSRVVINTLGRSPCHVHVWHFDPFVASLLPHHLCQPTLLRFEFEFLEPCDIAKEFSHPLDLLNIFICDSTCSVVLCFRSDILVFFIFPFFFEIGHFFPPPLDPSHFIMWGSFFLYLLGFSDRTIIIFFSDQTS